MSTIKEQILEALESAGTSDVIELWNKFAVKDHPDDQVFENNEIFFEGYFKDDVFGLVIKLHYGDYIPTDDYIFFDAQGNLRTISAWSDDESPVDIYALANWLVTEYDGNYIELAEKLEVEFELQ